MNKILFPGSFNPIHDGHLNMAKIASDKYDAEVILIPAVVSVWKSQSISFAHKLELVKLMVENEPRMSVSDYESTLGQEINYTINTVRYFVNKYPDDHFFLLIGEDQVNEFHRWKDALEISRLVKVIYYSRNGYQENDNIKTFNMEMVSGEEVNVSSTEIRDMKCLEHLNRKMLTYIEQNKLYYFDKIKMFIDEKRLSHSISVANLAYDIALSNHIDNPIRAYQAGLLHDIAKSIAAEEAKTKMKELFPEYADLPRFAYHQFLGSVIAKEEFGFDDEEILDAIMFHATGKAKMTKLGEIIYASDKIEPTRDFDSTDLIRACLKDYHKGFIEVLRANKEYLIEKKGPGGIENTLTLECFDYYL